MQKLQKNLRTLNENLLRLVRFPITASYYLLQ
jgi:hypothetical protein